MTTDELPAKPEADSATGPGARHLPRSFQFAKRAIGGPSRRGRPRPLLALLCAIAALAVLYLTACGERTVTIGNEVPDLVLPSYGGGPEIDLRDYRGNVLLLNFWASWCPPCLAEMPDIVALHAEYRSRGFEVLGVVLRSDPSVTDSVIATLGVGYKNALGNDGMLNAWRVDGFPTTYLLDTDGVARQRYHGARRRGTFERDIKRLLQ